MLLGPGFVMRDPLQHLVSASLRLPGRALGALLWTALLLGSGAAGGQPASNPPLPAIEFNSQIRPILADNCYLCHGPDQGTRKAGLRLDERDAALEGVKGRPAIVPGQSAASELAKRISSQDPDFRMPKPESGRSLTPQQVALLRQWIDQGAKYETHWAYVPPRKKALPSVRDTAWPRNPLDLFILAELEKLRLKPSPQADARTLIRRLSFDLLGLPPSVEEVDAFVADTSPQAYERLVERLLASPHYGERMAVSWLDLVRFADTAGYHGDQDVDVWPYRDYVVRAFNENLPFDQFTREQLAGDLLPNATPQQKVASAYNRLNMVTREGGAQAKEYLAKYAADRVRTTSSVWMASTLGCAQCHDHKFDPFSMKDFYRFAAFFADVKEQGVYESSGFYDAFPPVIRVTRGAQTGKLAALTAALATAAQDESRLGELNTGLHSNKLSLAEARQQVAAALNLDAEALTPALAEWESAVRERIRTGKEREVTLIVEDAARGGQKDGSWLLVDQAEGKPTHSGKRVRPQSGEGVVQHFAADFTEPQKLRQGDRLYAYVYLDAKQPPAALMLQWDTGGRKWAHRAFWGKDLVPFGSIGQDAPDHRRAGDLPSAGGWARLEVQAATVGLEPGDEIRGLALTQHGGRAWWDDAGVVSLDVPPEDVLKIVKKDPDLRTDGDRKVLLAQFFEDGALKTATAKRLAARLARERFEEGLPRCVVTESVTPRETRVLPRGNWMDDSGELVQPGIPHAFRQPKAEGGRRLTRLDLADWVAAPDNPLTGRVFVNRLWKSCFGAGLSKVLDDLGTRGEWPRQLDLLDWLAVEFTDSHWDVKHLVRLLVTSAAYRQSSRPDEKLKELDPFNRLCARQSRWRLDAEFVRDNALAISGLLVPAIGGPSVNPYQPADYYKELNFPKRTYTPDRGENQYRRGLYTHWQRTFLHPSLAAFDAPSREECTAERTLSNTPLQALTLLNDPTYLEAARVFAQHILEQGGASFGERLRWGYRRALARAPLAREEAAMKALFDQQLAEFRSDPHAAKQLVQAGYAPVPETLEPCQWAAWTSVGRTLLNLHETIVRY